MVAGFDTGSLLRQMPVAGSCSGATNARGSSWVPKTRSCRAPYVDIYLAHGILSPRRRLMVVSISSPHPILNSPNAGRKVAHLFHPNLQVRHRLPIALRLPLQRDLIDMLFPKRHLLPARKANPILQPVCV